MKRKQRLDIKYMCDYAGVSRSGYYAYLKRRETLTPKDIQDELDYFMIKEAYEYKSWKKGAKQIKMRMERNFGVIMNLKKIRRIMKKYNLICPIRKADPTKAILKAQQSHKTYGNIIKRCFEQGTAKKVLLTDITYLTYGNGRRAYLSVIKDASTKMILSWQISLTLELKFVIETVENLLDFYGKELDMNIILHSDQGVHYTSISYQQLLKDNTILQSMSRRGNCWDNAPQESFFAILKTEMDLKEYKTYHNVAIAIADHIAYYNMDRPQWDMHRMTPYEYDEYLSHPIYQKLELPMVIQA